MNNLDRWPASTAILHKFTTRDPSSNLVSVDTAWLAIYGGGEALVYSAAAQNSGAGYYWAIAMTPSTAGIYSGIWHAYYGTLTPSGNALTREFFRYEILLEQVD